MEYTPVEQKECKKHEIDTKETTEPSKAVPLKWFKLPPIYPYNTIFTKQETIKNYRNCKIFWQISADQVVGKHKSNANTVRVEINRPNKKEKNTIVQTVWLTTWKTNKHKETLRKCPFYW